MNVRVGVGVNVTTATGVSIGSGVEVGVGVGNGFEKIWMSSTWIFWPFVCPSITNCTVKIVVGVTPAASRSKMYSLYVLSESATAHVWRVTGRVPS